MGELLNHTPECQILTVSYPPNCYGGCTRGPREEKQVRLALETDSNVAIVGGDNRGAGK